MEITNNRGLLSEDEQELLFHDIWAEIVTLLNLPHNLYNATAERLDNGLMKGFGLKKAPTFENPDFELIKKLETQVFFFSGSKTFQQVRDFQNLLFDEDGFKRSFNDFVKGVGDIPGAKDIYSIYNLNWLQAEYQTTIKWANSAKQWGKIERDKDIFPLLEYVTVGDERVRPQHAVMDGIIRPVNDPFWNTRMPPNSWRCRCTVRQLQEGAVTNIKGRSIKKDIPNKMFRTNPGKKGVLFKGHPYFDVPKEFKDLQKRNFDLPTK